MLVRTTLLIHLLFSLYLLLRLNLYFHFRFSALLTAASWRGVHNVVTNSLVGYKRQVHANIYCPSIERMYSDSGIHHLQKIYDKCLPSIAENLFWLQTTLYWVVELSFIITDWTKAQTLGWLMLWRTFIIFSLWEQ
jgi:hypothetical protein